jgi:hypothetical protein
MIMPARIEIRVMRNCNMVLNSFYWIDFEFSTVCLPGQAFLASGDHNV